MGEPILHLNYYQKYLPINFESMRKIHFHS